MSVVFVVAVWSVLGAVVCFLSGRGSAGRRVPARLVTTPRRFAALPVHAWALEADRVALGLLLADPSDTPILAAPQG